MLVRSEWMTVDPYSNYRLMGKYIGAARMLELKRSLSIHSFLILTDKTGAYLLYTITAERLRQCFYYLYCYVTATATLKQN